MNKQVKEQVNFIKGYLDKVLKTSTKEIANSQLKTYGAYHSGRKDLALDLMGLVQKLERTIS